LTANDLPEYELALVEGKDDLLLRMARRGLLAAEPVSAVA
jgi:hypothetical protein